MILGPFEFDCKTPISEDTIAVWNHPMFGDKYQMRYYLVFSKSFDYRNPQERASAKIDFERELRKAATPKIQEFLYRFITLGKRKRKQVRLDESRYMQKVCVHLYRQP